VADAGVPEGRAELARVVRPQAGTEVEQALRRLQA
jgi:hypothetical protein